MKAACAIFLYTEFDIRFAWLTIACARSIRQFDNYPIFALIPSGTTGPNVIELLKKDGIGIWNERAIKTNGCFPYQTTKIRAIRHTEFDKVLVVDADFLAIASIRNALDCPSFTASCGQSSPLSAGFFIVKPDTIDYNNIIKVHKKGFNRKRGWGNYGPIVNWKTGQMTNWEFNGAHVEQGLLYYYYNLLKQQHNTEVERPFKNMDHKKLNWKLTLPEYQRYAELGIPLEVFRKKIPYDIKSNLIL